MKKTLLSAILVVVFLTGQGAKAQNSVFSYTHQGTTLYYIVDRNQHATVVPPTYPDYFDNGEMVLPWHGYTEPQGAIVIPDSVEYSGSQYVVTAVGERAFQHCDAITGISVPATVQSIGLGAMAQCRNMQAVTLAEGLIEIADWVFTEDSSLQAITIPESVTSLGEFVFSECTHLSSVTLPQQLAVINDGLFYYCHELENVVIPASLTEIGAYAFDSVLALAEIVLPEGFTKLGMAAFQDCLGLQRVQLPSTLNIVQGWAFFDCPLLDSLIFPDALRRIGPVCMQWCSSLTFCHLPEQLEYMGEWLLYGTGLTSIEVPSHVTRIDMGALAGCTSLHKVTLPASLLTLGDSVFIDGTPLDTIVFLCSVPPSANESVFSEYTATLIVPCGTADAYRQHAIWGRFANIEEKCNAIEDGAQVSSPAVYVRGGSIVVEGAEGETVQVFDIMGHLVHNSSLDAGVYLVKVGSHPARKVVVM